MTLNLELIFGNWILSNFAYFVYTSMAIATVSGFFYSYHFLTKENMPQAGARLTAGHWTWRSGKSDFRTLPHSDIPR